MHAFGPGQSLLAAKAGILRPAQAAPSQDQFLSVLQVRLASHLQRPTLGAAASGASPARDQQAGLAAESQGAGRQLPLKDRRLPPERLPELAGALLLAGFPVERLQTLLADPQIQQQGISLEELRQTWQEALGGGMPLSPGGAQPQTPVSGLPTQENLPPALTALLDLAAQSPEGVVPMPAARQPEIAALLREAGFSPREVEVLLTSPQVQEKGLTAEMLQAAWLKKAQGQQTESRENFPIGAEPALTSRSDYRSLWARLLLPVEAWPDLRLALQQLGATPEALAALEERLTPQGLPLGQVWQVIKQCLVEGQGDQQGAGKAAAPPSGPEVEQWRQLLRQAGFSADAVEGLLGVQTPASAAQLRERLTILAPSTLPLQGEENPKPLYLPLNLRLRSFPQGSRPDPDPGLGDRPSGREASPGLGAFPASHPSLPSEPAERFSAFLATPVAMSPPVGPAGSGSSWTLSPEIRQAFWSQLEAGILGNLQPGKTRLTLSLDPPQLGHMELSLHLEGQDLAVTAIITRPEAAHLAGAGLEQLAQALQQHGLTLSQFQVHVPEGIAQTGGVASHSGKDMQKKHPSPGGGDSMRRRDAGRVDRFA